LPISETTSAIRFPPTGEKALTTPGALSSSEQWSNGRKVVRKFIELARRHGKAERSRGGVFMRLSCKSCRDTCRQELCAGYWVASIILPMTMKPPETWTPERLEQAAISELLRHGGNKSDLKQLQAEFQKARENNNSLQPAQIEMSARSRHEQKHESQQRLRSA
jgi:hypothetical protein